MARSSSTTSGYVPLTRFCTGTSPAGCCGSCCAYILGRNAGIGADLPCRDAYSDWYAAAKKD